MTGLIEQILVERFGTPAIVERANLLEHRWNETTEPLRCLLFKPRACARTSKPELLDLELIYGDAVRHSPGRRP